VHNLTDLSRTVVMEYVVSSVTKQQTIRRCCRNWLH